MRKAISLLLVLCTVLALCGCGDENSDSEQLYKLGKGFVVEDFEYLGTDIQGNINFRLKLRNKTDKDLAEYFFEVQALDENKDIIANQLQSGRNILAGEAAWVNAIFLKSQYTDFPSYIRVIGVYINFPNNNNLEEIVEFPLNDSNN